MCGGNYKVWWDVPRQMMQINGEMILERTIRLLRENGVEDIAISTDNDAFKRFVLPLLKHNNDYDLRNYNDFDGYWVNAFYPTDEPTCYIFGDVVFSPAAIKKIVETETDDIELFGSAPPFADNYPKDWIEPFALKVVNTDHLKEAIQKTKDLDAEGKLWREPIMWELWTVIKDAPLQEKPGEYTCDYTVINDYTCDIDTRKDIRLFRGLIPEDE